MGIRMATTADTAELLAIYGQYIDTPITFEYELPTQAEFSARISGILAEYPYLVWEEDGHILAPIATWSGRPISGTRSSRCTWTGLPEDGGWAGGCMGPCWSF